VVNAHKTDFWLIQIPTAWPYFIPEVIVHYLGISFGVGLSLVAMWDWCLQRL
jgi:hypothetical protein